jgi:hypothetical protein
VDAFVPDDGQSALLLMPEIAMNFKRAAAADPEGFRLPANEGLFDVWGLRPGLAREFVRARFSDFSLRCFEEPVRLGPSRFNGPRAYVACVAENYPGRAIFSQFAKRAQSAGWPCHELGCGHDCHAELPDQLSDILEK